jgi:hypothetical protein
MTLTDLPTLSVSSPPPLDREGREAWVEDQADRLAEQTANRLLEIVLDAYETFLGTLTASGDLTVLSRISTDWQQYVDNALGPEIGDLHVQAGLSAWLRAEQHGPIPDDVARGWADVVNQEAVDYQRTATNRLKNVGDGLWGDVRDKTVTALSEGVTTDDLRKEIADLGNFTAYRAETIARTETHQAVTAGDRIGSEALGEFGPVEHVWVAAIDARTRESHAAAHNQVRLFNEPFQVGGSSMMRPGLGPPAEIINCRCYEEMLYPGDARPDGSIVEGDLPNTDEGWTPEPFTGELSVARDAPPLGGAHEKMVLTDTNGDRYLFKPMDEHLAWGEAAASEVGKRAGVDVPQVWAHNFAGRSGSLQKMVPNSRNAFPGSQHAFDPTLVSKADLDVLQQHRVLDWAVSNHDSHAGQFIRQGYANTGGKITGIDKGQVFKYWRNDKLDLDYHPNGVYGEASPVHNLIEKAYAENRLPNGAFKPIMKDSKHAAANVARAIQEIDDAEYRSIWRRYAEGQFRDPDERERFLDAAVARKNALTTDFTKYHAKLYNQRAKIRKAETPKAQPLSGAKGAPKGFQGAPDAEPRTAWMQANDAPIATGAKSRYPNTVDYTGNSYSSINGNLRSGKTDPRAVRIREELKAHAAKADFIVSRGVNRIEEYTPFGDPKALQGTVFRDRAVMSTHGKGYPSYGSGGGTAIRIRVNQGQMGAWVDDVSKYKGEQEYLLPDDTHLYVHAVRKPNGSYEERSFSWIIEAEVVDKEWVQSAGVRVWDSGLKRWSD